MSVIDILFRIDDICKKYDKYDVEKQRSINASSDDAFARLYSSFESQIEAIVRKSELAEMETNRATVVALNAEMDNLEPDMLRREFEIHLYVVAMITTDIMREELEARTDLVLALPERIQTIPDGSRGAFRQSAWGTSNKNIKFDSSDGHFDNDFFEQTEESSQFRQEYEMRKLKQACLEVISDGLDMLKNLAKDMNEELDRQVPLIDEIDTKVDTATSDLKRNNIRLKETLTRVRSTQNFCIDIILLCILLGIALYLYK
ncbi:syntaxin [Striga asiatica]|uniref:Syntaxin n=1 Tax=Striga asiatica TaxID=4170 RepID=A0A5A7QFG4_STRAF|nr:syntaxin [Striga asiatica]